MARLLALARAARGAFVVVLVAGMFTIGCGVADQAGDPGSAGGEGAAPSNETAALSDTTPTDLATGLKDLTEIGTWITNIYTFPLAVVKAYLFLNEITGITKSAEQRTAEALEAIRADIRDVSAKIAEGQTTVSAQLAAQTIAMSVGASETARAFVLANGGAVFDINTNPTAAIAYTDSRNVALTFMDDAWYSKVSSIPGTPRQFEWRLGLPHLIAAVSLRINVLAATHPDFVTSGAFRSELLGYYDSIGRRLDQAEQALIRCQNAVVPIGVSPPPDVPIRTCTNLQTGVTLGVGTLLHPSPDAPVVAQLLNSMGFDRIRAFRDGIYALAYALPQNSTFCSNEYEICWSSGTKTARYGADGGYFYRTMRGSFGCGNETFGDPIAGPVKSCITGDLIRYPCVPEWGTCYFLGVKAVRYGANGSYFSKLSLDGVACTNVEFGDPAVGTFKACDYADPVWTPCAVEGGTCSISGTQFVRYGYGNRWIYRKATSSFACNNFYGDPAVGFTKVCEVASLP